MRKLNYNKKILKKNTTVIFVHFIRYERIIIILTRGQYFINHTLQEGKKLSLQCPSYGRNRKKCKYSDNTIHHIEKFYKV